jgi:hypothetical protein
VGWFAIPGRELAPVQKRQTVLMRILSRLIVVVVLLTGCASDRGVADPGQDPADVANEVPYGVGVEVGDTYDYSLYVHCGVEWARIDGVWWRTDPLNDGYANPPAGWGNPYTPGTMTLSGPDVASFDGPTGTVEFTRTDIVDVPYECE